MDKYPYFISPLLTELKQAPSREKAEKIKMRIAANIGDPDTLNRLLGNDIFDLENFYPKEDSDVSSTEKTINTFIEKFSKPRKKKGASPSSLPENEAPSDYFLYVAEEEQDAPAEAAPSSSAEESSGGSLEDDYTMEDVKILVKNGEYQRALQIMNMFYLNNPKKSVYFADQIRFIKKMMVNDEIKRKKENS